jgi:hypothetical protein
MASNRSDRGARSVAEPASTETPKEALVAVARHTARIQIAALSAAGNALAGWASATDRFAQALADELLRRVDGEGDSRESVVRVAAAANAHLRELTALPSAASGHFDTRISRMSIDN